jgi:hypothetical protein
MPPADQAEKRVQPEEEEEEEDELRFRLMAMHRTPGAGGRTRNSKKKAICEPRRSLVGFTHDEPSTRGLVAGRTRKMARRIPLLPPRIQCSVGIKPSFLGSESLLPVFLETAPAGFDGVPGYSVV